MSFTVDDFQDLLRLLDQHPEWRTELRRHVLTEELLELPALVHQLAEAQVRTETQVATLASLLHDLTSQVERLTRLVDSLAGRVGDLTEALLELRYARRAPTYCSRIARRLRVLDPAVLADLLDDAVQEGRLTEGEQDEVLEADLVLTGRRREDQADVYLLIEVSAGIGPQDVQRAVERAEILAKLGPSVVPVVAGYWIDPEAATFAQASGVWRSLNGQARPPGQS